MAKEKTRSSAPTPEQRDIAQLLRDVIADDFADRFLDFCRLTNPGAESSTALRGTLPLAAHAQRELESFLRQILRAPFGEAEVPDDDGRLEAIIAVMTEKGFEPHKINNAVNVLRRSKHADEIRTICGKLNIPVDGETAKIWLSLVDRQQKLTHRRSIHARSAVDDKFRLEVALPFQALVHEVAKALRARYAVFFPVIDRLVAMPSRVKAITLFRDNVPGTLVLQQRFFHGIEGPDWLKPLMEKGLLHGPVPNLDDQEAGIVRWREWAPAHYLMRMAASPDPDTRALVATALRDLKGQDDIALRDSCFKIAAALPGPEAAGLVDVGVEWLKPKFYWLLDAPEQFLEQLINEKQHAAARTFTRALFAVSPSETGIKTCYDRFDYELAVPRFIEPLTALCGLDALALYCDLLEGAALAKVFIKTDPSGDFTVAVSALSDETQSKHDVYAALVWAVKRCAEQLVRQDKRQAVAVVDLLMARGYKIFRQLALGAAAVAPEALGALGPELLKRTDLVGETWCAREYGALARAIFPGIAQAGQDEILKAIDEVPSRCGDMWRQNFENWKGRPPTDAEMAQFGALTRRDAMWPWRDVLPAERQAELDQIVRDYGRPRGEDDSGFSWGGFREVSPASAAEIAAKPVGELVAFLKDWKPTENDERLTASALGTELRIAVEQEPQKFATAAASFAGLEPHYVLRILEGLTNQARNQKPFDWGPVLTMLEQVIACAKAESPAHTATDRDIPGWSWVLLEASALLRAGLYEGAARFPKRERERVVHLIEELWSAPAIVPDDFASRSEQDSYFGAQATLRGSVLEAAILYAWWCQPTKEEGEAGGKPFLPHLTLTLLDAAVSMDEASDPALRALIGHYFDSLVYLDQGWVDRNLQALFGDATSPERKAQLWDGYLLRGRVTLAAKPYIDGCLLDEAKKLGAEGYNDDRRGKPFIQMLLTYYYFGLLGLEPDGVLSKVLNKAGVQLREHGAWYFHGDLNNPNTAPVKRERLHAYYEWRIDAAERSSDRQAHRRELGMLALCFGKNNGDDAWLLQQLLRLARLELTPPHPINLFAWLQSMLPGQVDEVISAIHFILQDKGFDQWMFAQKNTAVKEIIEAGLNAANPETVERAKECANILVSRNQKDVLDLAS